MLVYFINKKNIIMIFKKQIKMVGNLKDQVYLFEIMNSI